jgi:superfamily II DNA or RNA helicase
MVLVNSEELATQTVDKMRVWHPDRTVGIEMASHHATTEEIIVASVPTIGRAGSSRIKNFLPSDFELITADEAHLSITDTFIRTFDHFGLMDSVVSKNAPLLTGFTATGDRADGKALGQVYDQIVYNYTTQQAIFDGWLSPPRGFKVSTKVDLSKVATSGNDFSVAELEKLVNTPWRNQMIVKAWIENASTRRTIAFVTGIQHAKDLAHEFQKAGVPAEAVWGDDPERERKLKAHKRGDIQVLVNAMLLVTGYDDPGVSCIIMARPTKSQTLFVQAIGRGLRLGEGIDNLVEAIRNGTLKPGDKRDCLILDCVDVTKRMSLVTLASLFGLPPEMDLNGKSITDAVAEIKEAQALNPNIDLTQLQSIGDLGAYLQEANLWKVTFCEEIKANSKLQWHKTLEGAYTLYLPGNESMTIAEDLLGKYSVFGSIKQRKYLRDGFHSLPEALDYAEMNITTNGKEFMTLLRREAQWHKGKPSLAQIAQLKRFKVPQDVISKMTKGDAHKFLAEKFGGRR